MTEQISSTAAENNQNISFQQLINDIHHYKLLKEQIKTYQNLISPSQRFGVKSIVPILHKRSKVIAKDFETTAPFNKSCHKSVQQLSKLSKSAHEKVHDILNQVMAADDATLLHEKASKLCEDYDAVDFTIQRLQTVFLDETFEEYSTDLDSLVKKYKKLCGMLDENENTTQWVIKQIRADQKELKGYAKEIKLTPIKKSTHSTYQNALPIIAEIFQFQAFVAKKKASNPLISQSLVSATTELSGLADSLMEEFNQWINLIYQYDQQIRMVQEHIKCFNMIADLMEPA